MVPGSLQPMFNAFNYTDTDEIPGFLLSLKSHIFTARSEDTISTFTCEDIGVAMVTNMNSQLQESFLLWRVVFYVENSSVSII